ncbi:tetratricopeptide repeat protein [Actinoplanes italicus]|uniref:Tetratricopeptide repeat protein n=1 Tax=Actinoplanes italicus TaxID=113567 RepID=A0A2T0JEH5_9ACTN|nr:tetratricopeptide repeat protein [Actinoplanes italicus]PRX05994.1 tetratricopeptide repeat protein [Actinoplanes italicus]
MGPGQTVDAVAGFGYGVVGADIHAFGDGMPLYVLRNRAVEPPAESAWLREMPSRMLNARFAVVGFTGRSRELAGLDSWRRSGPRLSAFWLHGPGGAGKSRLAAQAAEQAAADGWKVITAAPGTGSVLPPPGSQDLRSGDAPGVLLIVDYADRWPPSHLAWLLRNTLLHQVGPTVRVLLLSRTADVPTVLHNEVDRVAVRPLSPLATGGDDRTLMFTAARDDFAVHYGIDPAAVRPPPLADADFGLTLAVHMAALVAVDTHATGAAAGSAKRGTVAGLTIHLLDRENQHWATRPMRTSPRAMNRTVYTAALTGATHRRDGVRVLDLAAVPGDPGQVLADHTLLYPAANGTEQVLEPLLPDRLAEDFLALTLPGHTTDYPGQPWAAGTAAAVLTAGPARPLIFLIAATTRWAHVGATLLYPLVLDRPDLVVAAGSPALTGLAGLADVPVAVLEAVEALLPEGRHIDLDVGAAAITAALTRHRLARTRDRAERARLHHTLAWRLANAGGYGRAVASSRWAVTLRRELARTDSGHLPGLAASLNNLANQLYAAGRPDQAVRAGREAIRILRGLPADHRPELATALNNLGALLAGQGRRAAALRAGEEAVAIRRHLPDTDPAELAGALNNLAGRLAAVGRRADALAPGLESIELRRRLVRADRTAHLPDLASSLNNVAVWLAGLDRLRESHAATEEAAELYRELARLNPGAYRTDLASCLNNLGVLLTNLGHRREALEPSLEAVDIRRQLARANPNRHLADLAAPLNNLSILLAEQGRHEDALALAREAVDLYRDLVKVNSTAHTPDLAMSLTTLAARLSECGFPDEGLPLCAEAAALYRELFATEPDAWLPDLASAVHTLGVLLSEVGRPAEARAASAEAVDLRRALGRRAELGQSLTVLAAVLSENGEHAAALPAAEEATEIYQALTDEDPVAHRADLASALTNLGIMQWEYGHRARGVATTRSSAAEYRALGGHPADLAGALNNLGSMLSDLGRHTAALSAAREAVEIYRALTDPADLAMALGTYATACARSGRHRVEGRRAADEAVRLYERLAARRPEAFGHSLESARQTRDMLLRHS